ncbi:MAG TPA: hypothetical protein VM865_09850 [Acidobacteriaceae bacterium]|jgi:A/G-specific adenine glycosylase|nr:hypothetical protein [Acidobacteriaceae bacterium]
MLQQTRVATVVERYVQFLQRFPTIQALAEASEDDVLALWSGLGYYRRARMLHRGAQFVQRELEGKLPRKTPELRTLPGVGDYTAAAIASIAFGESVAVLDGNVERVLLRVLGFAEDRSGKARSYLASVAQALVPPSAKRRERSNPPGDHNQAMMELGATICLPHQPLCLQCPVVSFCQTRGEHATAVRNKPQSRMTAHLLALRKRGTATEVLLLRRPETATLMPKMLELPPLPLECTRGREPVLRLRHAITDTNYYVQIFAESAPGVAPLALDNRDAGEPHDLPASIAGASASLPETAAFRLPEGTLKGAITRLQAQDAAATAAELATSLSNAQSRAILTAELVGELDEGGLPPRLSVPEGALLAQIPASPEDLVWTPTARLAIVPLTGLSRKALQRLGVMVVPRLQSFS